MYGNVYDRERARALGDVAGEYKYQADVLKERLKSKDLTPNERANLIAAERELIRQAQKIALKRAVNKGAERIESELDDEMDRVRRRYPEMLEDLHSLQVQIKDAFDSVTGDAVQKWLQSTRTENIRRSKEDLKDAW